MPRPRRRFPWRNLICGTSGVCCLALRSIQKKGKIAQLPVLDYLAAISVGKIDGTLMLDLDYPEDARAEVDMNVVMTGAGKYVEVQGTAEGAPFAKEELDGLLALASDGIRELIDRQKEVLGPLNGTSG